MEVCISTRANSRDSSLELDCLESAEYGDSSLSSLHTRVEVLVPYQGGEVPLDSLNSSDSNSTDSSLLTPVTRA